MPVAVAGRAAGLSTDGTDGVAAVQADVVVERGQAPVALATHGTRVSAASRTARRA